MKEFMTKAETDFINKTEKNFKKMLLDIFEDDAIEKQEKIIVCAFMAETLHNILKEAGVDEWFEKNFLDKGNLQTGVKIGEKVQRQD